MEDNKYPIGKFDFDNPVSKDDIDDFIVVIRDFPKKLSQLINNWTDEQLDTCYRAGGWTVRQLINHLADSHINSFMRFKLALTEDNPTIKPYNEKAWAELQDSRHHNISAALQMLTGLHDRWTHLLKSLTNREFEKTFLHPGENRQFDLLTLLSFYAWHCNHHYAHIEQLKTEKGW